MKTEQIDAKKQLIKRDNRFVLQN